MQIPLIAEQGKGYSLPLNAVSTINFYPVADPGGKQKIALYGTPGCEQWLPAEGSPIVTPSASKWDRAVSTSEGLFTNSDATMEAQVGTLLYDCAKTDVGRSTSKRYFETLEFTVGGAVCSGVCAAGVDTTLGAGPDTAVGGGTWTLATNGFALSNLGAIPGNFSPALTNPSVLMHAVDFATGKYWFGRNGVWTGDPVAGTGAVYTSVTGTVYPATFIGFPGICTIRQNATEFTYSVPSGFIPWSDPEFNGVLAVDGGVRGCLELNDVGYFVAGNVFYVCDTEANVTQVGAIDTGDTPVNIETNGQQVVVCDGSSLWIYDITTEVFAQITDSDFPGAASFAVLDGYGLFNKPGTGQFYTTALLDFTSVDALDFATAESAPDDLVRVFANGGKAWMFGKRSIEPWSNTGDELFPFAPVGNVRIQRGIAGLNAVTECDGVPCFLGDNRIFYRLDGYTATPISKEDVEFNVGRMAVVDDCIAMSYTQEGHLFCAFKFPTEGVTWVWDVGTGLWHQRKSGDASWRANCMMKLGNRQLLGDDSTPRLLEVRTDLYEDDGAEMVAEHVLPAVWDDNTKIAHSVLEVDFESGIGSVTGSDPSVVLDWSDDGGRTWSNFLTRKLGKIGNYLYRAIFTRLGSSEQRNYRIRISDPVKRVITGVGLNRQDKGR